MIASSINLHKARAVVEETLRDGTSLGAQIYVSRAGQEMQAEFSVGKANSGKQMTSDLLLLWLSSGKPVTALAVAQQFERGRLNLESQVAEIIPNFGQSGKKEITIAHLLTHTGGFRPADDIPEETGWDETIRLIYETPIEAGWIPGEKAGYQSSASWFVLAEIVRRVDGRDFSRYVREEIFEPMQMRDSWIGMPRDRFLEYGGRIAEMFNTENGEQKLLPYWSSEKGCLAARPGGSARGPIRELGLFYEKLLSIRRGNTGVVKPETLKLFTRRQRAGMFDLTFGHVLDMGYGFILAPETKGPLQLSYGYGRYASPESFGHSGAQSSCAFADPKFELVVAWAFNGMPGERLHQRRARALNSAIYEDLNLA